MIEKQLKKYLNDYDLNPLVLSSVTREADTILVRFRHRKLNVEIHIYIGEEYIGISKDIPTKNENVAKVMEVLAEDLLEFIREKSNMRLRFLFKDYKTYVYGEPYSFFTRKCTDFFEQNILPVLLILAFLIPLVVLFFAFKNHFLYGLTLIPLLFFVPSLVYAGLKYVTPGDVKMMEQAKMQIIYSGMGIILSIVVAIVVKIIINYI